MSINIPVIAPAIPRPTLLTETPRPASEPAGGSNFASLLGSAISGVEEMQNTAHSATENLLTKGNGDIHEVALLSQRAELSMELFQQVRNKLVQTYQEVMRMPM